MHKYVPKMYIVHTVIIKHSFKVSKHKLSVIVIQVLNSNSSSEFNSKRDYITVLELK